MSHLSPADSMKLAELQDLCDDCKEAIDAQSSSDLKRAMQEACEKCQSVRSLVPELMELRLKTEEFVAELKQA